MLASVAILKFATISENLSFDITSIVKETSMYFMVNFALFPCYFCTSCYLIQMIKDQRSAFIIDLLS